MPPHTNTHLTQHVADALAHIPLDFDIQIVDEADSPAFEASYRMLSHEDQHAVDFLTIEPVRGLDGVPAQVESLLAELDGASIPWDNATPSEVELRLTAEFARALVAHRQQTVTAAVADTLAGLGVAASQAASVMTAVRGVLAA